MQILFIPMLYTLFELRNGIFLNFFFTRFNVDNFTALHFSVRHRSACNVVKYTRTSQKEPNKFNFRRSVFCIYRKACVDFKFIFFYARRMFFNRKIVKLKRFKNDPDENRSTNFVRTKTHSKTFSALNAVFEKNRSI